MEMTRMANQLMLGIVVQSAVAEVNPGVRCPVCFLCSPLPLGFECHVSICPRGFARLTASDMSKFEADRALAKLGLAPSWKK
jgi:hypothetical protein